MIYCDKCSYGVRNNIKNPLECRKCKDKKRDRLCVAIDTADHFFGIFGYVRKDKFDGED